MSNKLHKEVLLIYGIDIKNYFKIKNENIDYDEDCYVRIPTIDDKKSVLDHVEFPDFDKYIYIPFEAFKSEIQKKLKKSNDNLPFIKIQKCHGKIVTVDNKGRRVIGNKKNPYKLYEPQGYDFSTGEVIPYVCYHSNGDVIIEVIEKIIEKLPEDASEDSVILLFQWTNDNPVRSGYYVNPKLVTVNTLIRHLKNK